MKLATVLMIFSGALFAQPEAPPAPPAPPTPRAVPAPAPAPYAQPTPAAKPARPAPLPPIAAFGPEYFDQDQVRELAERAREEAERAREKAQIYRDQMNDFRFDFDADAVREMKLQAETMAQMSMDLRGPFLFAPQPKMGVRAGRQIDSLYDAGTRAIDNHRYEEALENFNQVVARAGARADGALYWKAYTLNKLGRRDDALAAIAELRKSYATSGWLDDAKALELEVRQSSGQPMSPEAESDDDLKLLALNGLVHSDPDRAFPILENLLKSGKSPKLKKNALYVIAQTNTPRAQQLLEQVARGKGNPDLQLAAISYLGERRRTNTGPLLLEIYNGASDLTVKRRVLNALRDQRDNDRLLDIAKTEKNQELRLDAIRYLGDVPGSQPEIWKLIQSETSPDAKLQILQSIPSAGNQERILELLKQENDAKLRKVAVQRLSEQRASTTGDALVGIYTNEKDQEVKRAIVDALSGQRNGKALIECAKKETDPKLKHAIVERMVNIHSPEVNDYLLEILK